MRTIDSGKKDHIRSVRSYNLQVQWMVVSRPILVDEPCNAWWALGTDGQCEAWVKEDLPVILSEVVWQVSGFSNLGLAMFKNRLHMCEYHLSLFDNPLKLKQWTGVQKVQNVNPSSEGFVGS